MLSIIFFLCRIWLLPWKRAERGPPFLPDFQMTSLVQKLNGRGKQPSLPAGMKGKQHPSSLPPVSPLPLGGGPGTTRDSSAKSLGCAARLLRGSLTPLSPLLGHPLCPRLGGNLQASNPVFPVVFPSGRCSLVLESFRAGAIPGRGWRHRLPLPGRKGKKKGICTDVYILIAHSFVFFPLHKSGDVSPLRG